MDRNIRLTPCSGTMTVPLDGTLRGNPLENGKCPTVQLGTIRLDRGISRFIIQVTLYSAVPEMLNVLPHILQADKALGEFTSGELTRMDAAQRGRINRALDSLRLAQLELSAHPVIIADCGYSSPQVCPHWKYNPVSQDTKDQLKLQLGGRV